MLTDKIWDGGQVKYGSKIDRQDLKWENVYFKKYEEIEELFVAIIQKKPT